MLAGLKQSLAQSLRRVALSAGAGFCLLIGAAFFTVAGWIYLAATISTLAAALIIGAVWLALGFILLGIARVRTAPAPTPQPAPQPTPPPGALAMADAFLFGFEAGRSRSRRE